jgi:isopentenyl diphosphate isomerase/L-lactate dehydrogenase-like FMN-dependent dehydrogenase
MKDEVQRDMALAGLRSIAEITPDLVRRLGPDVPFGRNAP